MICPVDSTQMIQYQEQGGGTSTDEFYETWEIKLCLKCGRKYKEYYSCELLEE